MRDHVKRSLPGSLTVEASFVVPMIIFCMALFIVTGFRQASSVINDFRQEQAQWTEDHEESMSMTMILRGGDEASGIIDALRGG